MKQRKIGESSRSKVKLKMHVKEYTMNFKKWRKLKIQISIKFVHNNLF